MSGARWTYLVSLLSVLAAIGLWLFTGREGYTRWPDTRLERADVPASAAENALLQEAGFSGADEKMQASNIQSRFAFGLVPGGFDGMHLPSVALVAALAAAASCGARVVSARVRRTDLGPTGRRDSATMHGAPQ